MKKYILTLASLLIILMVCNSCKDKYTEEVSYGDYYITNNTLDTLIVTASSNSVGSDVVFLTNKIALGNKTHIYTFKEGSGGHVLPSNAWSDFHVYKGIISDSTIVYSGINNNDWVNEGSSSQNHLILNLTIQ